MFHSRTYVSGIFVPIKFGIDPKTDCDWKIFEEGTEVDYFERILSHQGHIDLLNKYLKISDATAFNGPSLVAHLIVNEYCESDALDRAQIGSKYIEIAEEIHTSNEHYQSEAQIELPVDREENAGTM